MAEVRSDDRGILFSGTLTLDTISPLEAQTRQLLRDHSADALRADLSQVGALDTAGAVFLHRLPQLARQLGKDLAPTPLPTEKLQRFYTFVTAGERPEPSPVPRANWLEALGAGLLQGRTQWSSFFYLMSDLTWAALASLFRRTGIRRDSFADQAIAIGSQGLPIIALILFLIGAVMALQATAQLRKFGANIYVADLLAVSLTRELGPLMTAIIVSGRSGSAIAAEIATMKFTEELDALKTMALDPLRFVAVPKLWAMVLCVPLLTVMADFCGILGGVFVAVAAFDIGPQAFFDQVVGSLFLKDILTGLVKSVSFGWIITIIAVFRGLEFSGGAAGVGHATTASVVTALFGIIFLDSAWGLIFYMR